MCWPSEHSHTEERVATNPTGYLVVSAERTNLRKKGLVLAHGLRGQHYYGKEGMGEACSYLGQGAGNRDRESQVGRRVSSL